jgi:hypothetical protein
MNQKSIDPLSEIEAFLKSRASKNKRRKEKKNEHPEVFIYTQGHTFRGCVLEITSEFVEINQREEYRNVFPAYVDQGVCFTGLYVVISRKNIVAVAINKNKLGEP